MTLGELLLMIEGEDYLPLTVEINDKRLSIDCIPSSPFKLMICFMCEEETWIEVSTYSPILVPWYDCEVASIEPYDHDVIQVWLDSDVFLYTYYKKFLRIKNIDDDNETHADKVTKEDIKKLDNTDSSVNPHICTICDHFICDDVEHLVGHCNKLGITRRSGDICVHEEEMS